MPSEVGVAYVNILPKADGFTSGVAEASKEAGQQGANSIKETLLGSLKGTFGEMFSTGGEMGSKLAGGMEQFLSGAGKVAIIGAVAMIGAEALRELEQIGAQIDAMTDSIIVGTGAAGDQLESLKQTAMGVATDVPAGFAKSGDIIQDFNTRLGLSGEELDKVATSAAQLDYIVGGINYDNMATMFNVWGVGADDMTAKMDYMWGVAQNTGIGFDQLTSIMKSSGPTLQNLGFSFEESANMAGLLDKSGIDASSTMSRLSKALVEVSKPGESAQETFRRTVDEMQAYIDAGDTASAMDLATQLFGTRGAAQFIGALQSGALSMDALSDASLGATGSVQGTYDAIKSWPETWQLIQTRVQAALEPLGSAVFQTLGAVLNGVTVAMDAVWQATEPLRTAFGELAAGMGERLAPVVEVVGSALSALGSTALVPVSGLFTVLGAAVSAAGEIIAAIWDGIIAPFGEFMAGTFGPVIDGAGNTVNSVFSAIGSVVTSVMTAAGSVVTTATNAIRGAFTALQPIVGTVTGIFDSVKSAIEGPINTAKSAVETAINAITSIINGAHLELPHFALPHFNINGGELPWGIGGQGTPPSISVDWYASGGFVNGATLIGAGEAGPEMILPASGGLMDDFSEAVASQVDTAAVVDEIRKFRREIGPIIADYAPHMTQREFNRAARTAVAYG